MHNEYNDGDGYDGEFDDVRAKAEARVKKREAVRRDLARFIMIDIFLWVMLFMAALIQVPSFTLSQLFWGLIAVSIPVGLIVIGRWFAITQLAPAREHRYHDELKREIQIEMERRNLTEKRKRLALSDDGELAEISDDYTDDSTAPRKRERTRYD